MQECSGERRVAEVFLQADVAGYKASTADVWGSSRGSDAGVSLGLSLRHHWIKDQDKPVSHVPTRLFPNTEPCCTDDE
ncbi:Linear gramicidin synthase subunit C [Clarias magur]|uniref:Linear gramicidin synthase subunit C n=1 Tax=Clarias magur TaxID=1594786 RepID=A0A8J4U2S9_CLAMG|nr:Linear gramicidin synthase subunit C [Clarias magur]